MQITPIGLRHSEPSPVPNATGTIPSTVDTAVISTGRRRTGPASRTASRRLRPRSRRVFV
jgi:hypothetical protein